MAPRKACVRTRRFGPPASTAPTIDETPILGRNGLDDAAVQMAFRQGKARRDLFVNATYFWHRRHGRLREEPLC